MYHLIHAELFETLTMIAFMVLSSFMANSDEDNITILLIFPKTMREHLMWG